MNKTNVELRRDAAIVDTETEKEAISVVEFRPETCSTGKLSEINKYQERSTGTCGAPKAPDEPLFVTDDLDLD